ncbi:MAG: cytochrome [Rhodobacteraceae bacterium]|nr:MAG: cytochrome [Paracoccaceae bacterium]
MPRRNTAGSYGSVTKTFHWLIALLIVTIIPVGLVANEMAEALRDPAIPSTAEDFTRTFLLFSIHKTLGVAIFWVALARILWAFTQPKPRLLNADNRVEAFLAETVHWLLYGSLVLVPLTGWIDHAATTGFAPIWWPFGQSLPFVPKDPALSATFAGLHVTLQRVLIISLLLHIAGALKHHFIDRDFTLRRMLPGSSAVTTPPAHRGSALPPLAAVLVWVTALGIGTATGLIVPPTPTAPPAELADVASDWQVTEGTLALSITQLGNTTTGTFADWTAAITFDETAPGPLGKVEVTVAIASLTLGNVTAQAMGPDFFDADFFPEATFSGEITRTETGYVATGPLVIRDTSLPVSLPFDLTLDGDRAQMTGKLSLNRLDFGVGSTMVNETSLGFGVDIIIDLRATRGQ